MYEFAHVSLVVKDVEKTGAFYQEVLGCQKVGAHQDERMKFLFLKAGQQTIELLEYITAEEKQRTTGIIDHIAFKVDNMEAAIANLRAAGVKLLFDAPVQAMGGLQIMFFEGPDGERIEFMQENRNT